MTTSRAMSAKIWRMFLNELLDAEADRLCHAKRYERNAERASTRAGSYKRKIETFRKSNPEHSQAQKFTF